MAAEPNGIGAFRIGRDATARVCVRRHGRPPVDTE